MPATLWFSCVWLWFSHLLRFPFWPHRLNQDGVRSFTPTGRRWRGSGPPQSGPGCPRSATSTDPHATPSSFAYFRAPGSRPQSARCPAAGAGTGDRRHPQSLNRQPREGTLLTYLPIRLAAIVLIRTALAGQVVRRTNLDARVAEAICAAPVKPGDRTERDELVAATAAAIPFCGLHRGRATAIQRDRNLNIEFSTIENGQPPIGRHQICSARPRSLCCQH